ncbi:hypothetical protein BJ878DRAFT_539873 [Calycina marina]|uniref:Uncharacterized protein n=1 Tax=Calycina marina TaxID=1763456 RepID=A0A9P8CH30_9HELO|nr:hypothetical protein BJ878DRAFT_539873 [Calycina marina]
MTAGSATRLSEPESLGHPDKFDGTNPAISSGIVDVIQKITNDPRQYTSEISRVRYALSRLTGEAKESVAFAYDRNGAMKLDNAGACDAFPTTQPGFDHIGIAFGDTDEAFTAEGDRQTQDGRWCEKHLSRLYHQVPSRSCPPLME